MTRSIFILTAIMAIATICNAENLDARIGATKEVEIDILSMDVKWNESKDGMEFYEPPSGWYIVEYKYLERSKFGKGGYSASLTAANSDFISEEKINQIFKDLTDYAKTKGKEEYKERLETLKQNYLDSYKRVRATHSRLETKWKVQGEGNLLDQKGGSLVLGAKVTLIRFVAPKETPDSLKSFYIGQMEKHQPILGSSHRVALDANGGKGGPYFNSNLDPNDNHLYEFEQVGDFVRIIPKVLKATDKGPKKVTLDANGGKDGPYFNENLLPNNNNHLYKLEKVNNLFMIIPKVRRVALDANIGKGGPYFNDKPDPNNPNHLWEIQDIGGYKRIVSALVIRD